VTLGRLILPGLRWQGETGFEHERPAIDRALAFGAGGFILFGGTVESVAALTRDLREQAGRPLLIGSDLERGAGQQVRGLTDVPPPGALASLDDSELIRWAGAITGAEARSVGIDWVYAPDADLDLAAENPIVQTRSFGADPERVAAAVTAWIEGCQSTGALACAKHFPGHGRTVVDSHDRLPEVGASRDDLAATDLVPFRAAIEAGVASIMTAHVSYPALDPAGRPATLSPVVLGLLRDELGFDGLVVTDALIMKGVFQDARPESAAVDSLVAGVDLMPYPIDPAATFAELERRAHADPAVRLAADRALGSYHRGLARAGATRPGAIPVDRSAETARRLLDAAAPAELRLRAPLELVVVDDDTDGAWPAGPSDDVERALGSAGVPLGPGGSRVVLVFAEPRASKGRAGLGPVSRRAIAAAMPADLLVLFAHPRLRADLPGGAPVIQGWHRQRLMQEAAAGWIRERLA